MNEYLGDMIQSNNYQINEYKRIDFLQIIVMRRDVHRSPCYILKPF